MSMMQGEPVKKGVFGKCIVERKSAGFSEHIFEFNLTKCGNEEEQPFDNSDGWSLMALRELASELPSLCCPFTVRPLPSPQCQGSYFIYRYAEYHLR